MPAQRLSWSPHWCVGPYTTAQGCVTQPHPLPDAPECPRMHDRPYSPNTNHHAQIFCVDIARLRPSEGHLCGEPCQYWCSGAWCDFQYVRAGARFLPIR
jgi:hypothetical protein